ncbi:DUF4209 domain-containing protein [Streptomyces antibioticus]|uniref:DUF4209 domain-containing protein n=1 Tax=Streptomyces antibioticus TaxID=1890 RepID=A0AAE6Y4I7_STRAT|nr:hypothetical protein [Streptomyces antibioticus]OOQ55318.1 hypothetical protein AFM16_04755 [Streptomyces antibioticus]QIT42956.1 hypothetical protein HCX60_04965 [Streptomyces antibioticus]
MTQVQATVLKKLDSASNPFTSYQEMVTALAAAVGEEGRTEAELDHLHALCAAMLFFHQPDGALKGSYRGPGPEPWPTAANQLPPEVRAVWVVYADAAGHPMVRARLHHLLWEARHGSRPFDHVSAAIAGYREAVPVLLADTGDRAVSARCKAVDALLAAHDLAVRLRQPQLADIATEMVGLAATALDWPEPSPGIVHAAIEPLLADKNLHQLIRPVLERAVDRFRADSHSRIGSLQMMRRIEADPTDQQQIDQRILAAYTDHAEQLDGLPKLMRLEEAAAFARDHGLTDALDEIRRTQQKLRPEDLCLTRMITPLQFPTALVDAARAAVDSAADLSEALRTIATAVPVLADPIDAEQHGLLRLPTAHLNLNGPVVTAFSEEGAAAGTSRIDALVFSLGIHGVLIEAQLDQLHERFAPTEDQLLGQLTNPPHAPASRMRGLARALRAFWEHEDDVAITLALPRVEGLLRRRIQAADVSFIQHHQGDRPGQVSQLGSLITDMDKAGYPEPWPTFFRTLVGGPTDGLNLRNNVLHDLVDTPPRHQVALVIKAALSLLFVPLEDPADSGSPAADS